MAPFVLLGDGNLDPADGDGLREGIAALAGPSRAAGRRARAAPMAGQSLPTAGDPALDTALYDDLGGLRLDYVLPSAGLKVTGVGCPVAARDDPLAADLAAASRHFPVWVDLALPASGTLTLRRPFG